MAMGTKHCREKTYSNQEAAMPTAIAFAEDALRVYILADAYFYDTLIGNFSLESNLFAKEKRAGVFQIWRQEDSSVPDEPVIPPKLMAVCTYSHDTKTWKVSLSNGEKLTLIDNGNVWDIVVPSQNYPTKRQRRRTNAGKR